MSTSSQVPLTYTGPQTPTQLAARLGIPVEQIIKLDANENPYGPPPAALSAFLGTAIGRYPDAEGLLLRERITAHTGARLEQVVLGNGSDELIELVCRLLLRPGDEAVLSPPTFSVYAIAARAAGACLVEVARRETFGLEAGKVCEAVTDSTRLVFLCSPNNPTGELLPEADLRAILSRGVAVLLDEAYSEFAGWSALPLAGEYPNLLVLRTFSKAYGLAGLRVGYGIFPEELASSLQAARLPYNVNAAAQAAAAAALEEQEWVQHRVDLIVAERQRLSDSLTSVGALMPLPSDANFLLVRADAMPARRLYAELLKRGIMVRYFSQPELSDYVRITVGTPEQNDVLLRAIESIVRS